MMSNTEISNVDLNALWIIKNEH